MTAFCTMLRDTYFAEQTISTALAGLRSGASRDVKSALQLLGDVTAAHLERLRTVFELAGGSCGDRPPCRSACALADVATNDAEAQSDRAGDVGLVAVGEAFARFQVSRYSVLVAWSDAAGREELSALLRLSLVEKLNVCRRLAETRDTLHRWPLPPVSPGAWTSAAVVAAE